MGAIRADWRLAELDLDAEDPFEAVILSTGLEIDLRGGERAIQAALAETLRIEALFFNRGVVCDLKDGGQDCLTCGSYTADAEERRSKLCRLGRDQRNLCLKADGLAADRLAAFRELGEQAERFYEVVELLDLAAA